MAHYTARQLQTVEAWKYVEDEPIPVWVAKTCHFLGDGKLTANSLVGVLPVDPGDYIIKVESEGTFIGVQVGDGETFEKEFEPTPRAGEFKDNLGPR